jgi:hypothetical protein
VDNYSIVFGVGVILLIVMLGEVLFGGKSHKHDKPKALTPEEHKARHEELHRSLDELMADYRVHHPYTNSGANKSFNEISVWELVEWSHEQTKNPTPIE